MKKILKSIFVLAMTLTVLQLPVNLAIAQEDDEQENTEVDTDSGDIEHDLREQRGMVGGNRIPCVNACTLNTTACGTNNAVLQCRQANNGCTRYDTVRTCSSGYICSTSSGSAACVRTTTPSPVCTLHAFRCINNNREYQECVSGPGGNMWGNNRACNNCSISWNGNPVCRIR